MRNGWQSAPASDKGTALRVAEGLEDAQYAVYSLSVFIFLGIGILLYGLATLLSTTYAKAPGWIALLSGFGTAVVGAAQALNGPSVRGSDNFFVLFSMLSTLWILIKPRVHTPSGIRTLSWPALNRQSATPHGEYFRQ